MWHERERTGFGALLFAEVTRRVEHAARLPRGGSPLMGTSLPVIGKMLGHKSVATTQRYAHLVDDVVREAIDQAGDRIEEQTRASAGVIDLEARRMSASRSPG